MFWKQKSKPHFTRVQLWRRVLSYVWDISLMYGILVLCMGYQSYVLGISLKFWRKNQNHRAPGCNYGGVYCLMFGILVLCMGYQSYVWDISLMYWALVLCIGYQSYALENKSKSHVTRVQLWRSVLSYVWDISLMYGILV